MSLEAKSLTELRGIAQAVGIKFKWDENKNQLVAKIGAKVTPKIEPPKVSQEPSDHRLRTRPPGFNLPQPVVAELVKSRFPAIILTFPSPDTWEMYYSGRSDSGSLRVPLRVIVDCAKSLMNG